MCPPRGTGSRARRAAPGRKGPARRSHHQAARRLVENIVAAAGMPRVWSKSPAQPLVKSEAVFLIQRYSQGAAETPVGINVRPFRQPALPP